MKKIEGKHKNPNKIGTIILFLSILSLTIFFIIAIAIEYNAAIFLFGVLFLIFGVIGFMGSVLYLIYHNFIEMQLKRKIILLSIILFTLLSTFIFRFSWISLILLPIINISMLLFFEGIFKFTKDRGTLKRPNRKYKIPLPNFFLLFLMIVFTYYTPFKYFSIIIVLSFTIFSSYAFRNNIQEFFDKIEKMPKSKAKLTLQNIRYQQYIFILMFPIIIDITFSVLKVPLSFHIVSGVIYITLYFIISKIFSK